MHLCDTRQVDGIVDTMPPDQVLVQSGLLLIATSEEIITNEPGQVCPKLVANVFAFRHVEDLVQIL